MATQTFQVRGMSCDHCVHAVTTEVGALDGVRSVAVDLATGTVVVDSDEPLDPVDVDKAVDEAGYELVT